jgi:pyruvate-formate lyase-activating enzyme
MLERNFVLEVLSLYIPALVEAEELERIASLLVKVDPAIPFTVLAFFPEYMMREHPTPTVENMVGVYRRIRNVGLENVRLGNVGVFARTEEDQRFLIENLEDRAY